MKKMYLSMTSIVFGLASGQVGVNTESPKTTLDVSPGRDTSGIITNPQLMGMKMPHLTTADLVNNTAIYGTEQTAALIYITDVTGGDINEPRTFVDSVGYYYFDAILCQKAKGKVGGRGTEYWLIKSITTEATINTQDIYQKGNVVLGTNQGISVFHIDAAKNNPITGIPNNVLALSNLLITSKGRLGIGYYSPSDITVGVNHVDDKITFPANIDLDIHYSLAITNNNQAIVYRNLISGGSMGVVWGQERLDRTGLRLPLLKGIPRHTAMHMVEEVSLLGNLRA